MDEKFPVSSTKRDLLSKNSSTRVSTIAPHPLAPTAIARDVLRARIGGLRAR
jgi:hypothetical protein